MKIAAVHFNPKIQPHLQHNDRTNSTAKNIIKELSYQNECDKSAAEALKEIDELYKKAMDTLTENKVKGKRTPKERSYHEAIIEIDEKTTMEQLKTLTKEIENLTGFKTIQISIHRDEGHQENDEFKTHYHAHAVFFTLDQKSGKQLARQQASLNKRNLSKMQDLASKILEMKRGKEYFKNNEPSPNYTQDHRDFIRLKEHQKNLNEILLNAYEAKKKDLEKKEQRIKEIEKDFNQEIQDKKKHYQEKLYSLKGQILNILSFGKYAKSLNEKYNQERNTIIATAKQLKEKAEKEIQELQKRTEKEIQQLREKAQTSEKKLNLTFDILKQDFYDVDLLKQRVSGRLNYTEGQYQRYIQKAKENKTVKKSEFEISLSQYQNNETNTYDSFKDFKKAMEETQRQAEQFHEIFNTQQEKERKKRQEKKKDQGLSR